MVKGENVAAMGGFTGRETVLTSSYLSRLVRSGQARYFLLGGSGGFGPGGQSNAATSLIESTCTAVSSSAWSSGSASSGSTLVRLRRQGRRDRERGMTTSAAAAPLGQLARYVDGRSGEHGDQLRVPTRC